MLSKWLLAARPKTLLTSISPILLGSLTALPFTQLNYPIFILALLCALSLQVAVNFANDLFDALSGVDTVERLGPKRAVQSGLIKASEMKVALFIATATAMLLGLYLIVQGGWPFFMLGVLSVIGVFAYSAGPKPLASQGLGEVTVFIFFGLIAVLGSYYLQAYDLSWQSLGFAINTGMYASAILLVNNIRDIDTDRQAQKYTLALKLGENKSRSLLRFLLITPLVIHTTFLADNVYQLVTLLLCSLPVFICVKQASLLQGKALNNLLGQISLLNFIYCLTSLICWQINHAS